MVYLAVLLILCGLLILITALSVETGRITSSGFTLSTGAEKVSDSHTASSGTDEVEIIFPEDKLDEIREGIDEEDIFISFDDETDDSSLYDSPEFPVNSSGVPDSSLNKSHQHEHEFYKADRRKPDSAELTSAIGKKESLSSSCKDAENGVQAVMFDDRSNIIDYESGVGAIDSTFSKYKSIKRIGKGRIESDYDGVNFYLDEKLYRFDFHKVYDIWSGSDYVALPLKGNSTVKLFLIQNSHGFPGKVEADFKEYEKGL